VSDFSLIHIPHEPPANGARSSTNKSRASYTNNQIDGLAEKRKLQTRPLTDVQPRSIEWLEKPLWQRSAFQLLVGPSGVGKGTYLAGLAARVTRQGANVLFISTEDSAAIDLVPRLTAAEADLSKCHIPQTMHVKFPADLDLLEEAAKDIGGIGLLVVDPIASHIGAADSNSETAVRDAIGRLNKLSETLDCLIIGVRHLGKSRERGALASVLGSTAWVDTPRAVVAIASDDEDESIRVIQVVAGNRAQGGTASEFRIEAVDVKGLKEPITLAVDLGESSRTVDEILTAPKDQSRSRQARELILDILEAEDAQNSELLDARVAKELGIAIRTVKNQRYSLGNEGLVKFFQDRDELGVPKCWMVARTAVPRS
jgi:hypothetical protein